MGDTEAKVSRTLWLSRIVLAGVMLLIGVIAIAQFLFFPDITINFETGVDAQQIESMQIKRGSDVDLPTPLKSGSYFVGWSLNQDGTKIISNSKNLTNGTTLYAVWDGVEKYSVLMVNGVKLKEINAFDTSDHGLTPDELSAPAKTTKTGWRLLDDYAEDNTNRQRNGKFMVDPDNNYQRFLGWRYLNSENQYNELRYDGGNWFLLKRDANGETITPITNENKFYPPSYRTTFTAILQYRKINFQLYEQDGTNPYDSFIVDVNATNVKMPVYTSNNSLKFSHWQIIAGGLSNSESASEEIMQQITTTQFVSGEIVENINPLWYYLGSSLIAENIHSDSVVVNVKLRAVDWQNAEADKYTMQLVKDENLGLTKYSVPATSADNLTLDYDATNPQLGAPVVFNGSDICLLWHKDIFSYTFYDHRGNRQVIEMNKTSGNVTIPLGVEKQIGEQVIYLNANWGVNFIVKYKSATNDVKIKFMLGSDLYVLPDYRLSSGEVVMERSRNVGDELILLSAEKYTKQDWLFYGWHLKGEPNDVVYNSGSVYVIPAMDTASNNLLEFEAVWRRSRLLFDFNFNGGNWAKVPNFNSMKGAYGQEVNIVSEIPIRFGYHFVGWSVDDDPAILQPNALILINTEIQTLHAHWRPKNVRITYYTRTDPNESSWQPDPVVSGLRVEDEIKLPFITANRYWNFIDWQNVGAAEATVELSSDLIANLSYRDLGDLIDVSIYAHQERRWVEITYDFGDVELTLDQTAWPFELSQGDTFWHYAPFNLTARDLDMEGRRFKGWEYREGRGGSQYKIEATTTVPDGQLSITIYPTWYEEKNFIIRYYTIDFFENYGESKLLYQDENIWHYRGTPRLLQLGDTRLGGDNIYLPEKGEITGFNKSWGTFVGWSVVPDYEAGNPEIIFDVRDNSNPRLALLNVDDMKATPYYKVRVDYWNEAESTISNNYFLNLYAVYAQDNIRLAYSNTEYTLTNAITCPVYLGNDADKYTKSALGGKTVGYEESADLFAQYGNAVLDDSILDSASVSTQENFVGWEITVPAGVTEEWKNYFENRLWFAGDFLPAIDFNLSFKPRFAQSTKRTLTVGDRTYRVRWVTLNEINATEPLEINNADIVVLPKGSYCLKTGKLKINNDQEVHVVIPTYNATGISLEALSIQCDQIVDFYVSDNWEIYGNPVVGANFTNYRIKKGCYTYDIYNKVITAPAGKLDNSQKYDMAAAVHGILITKDHALIGLPCNNDLGVTDPQQRNLKNMLEKYQVNRIKQYALTDISQLTELNLTIDGLQIDENAIFATEGTVTTVAKINLPQNSTLVSAQCVSGYQVALAEIYFGDELTCNYAFVDQGFVYYDTTASKLKKYLMYVLPSAKLRNLDYTVNDLQIPSSVEDVNPYAFAGRDWRLINSLTAENPQIDLRYLLGVPNYKPKFVNVDNPNKGYMIQPYVKTLKFNCEGYATKTVSCIYGQYFTIFDPKDNNPYGFLFDREWCKFLGWTVSGYNDLLTVGTVYKVGIDDVLFGDGYVIELSASSTRSWLSYPVRFHIFNGSSEIEYRPESFVDDYQRTYTMNDLIGNEDILSTLYLPGLDYSFTDLSGTTYQFVGWGLTAQNSFNSRLWNNAAPENRILPNHEAGATLKPGALNGGQNNEGYNVRNFYALYDKVSRNLAYTLTSDGYSVQQNNNANETKIYIPFAKYNNGYMTPVTAVADYGFNSLSNVNEIEIGGAVNRIGEGAFADLEASVTFAHRGQYIKYGNHSNQLVIGKQAFFGNSSTAFKKLVIPAAVTSIGDSAFAYCPYLQTVVFEELAEGEIPAINRLGNFIFREDLLLSSCELTQYLIDDGVGNKPIRFYEPMGYGIFMGTNVTIANTNRIVWRDTVLHTYGDGTERGVLEISESKVAGYAFANANAKTGVNPVNMIRFTNPNASIAANAFAYLDGKIDSIDLRQLSVANVNIGAFNSITHHVNIIIGSVNGWSKFNQVFKSNPLITVVQA